MKMQKRRNNYLFESCRDDVNMKISSQDCRNRIVWYLKDQTRGGPRFFKAKWIAKELGLTSRQVGSNLILLVDQNYIGIQIERYTGSSGYVWKVLNDIDVDG